MILKQRAGELSEAGLARFVTRARRAARLDGAVHVMVTSNREMRQLNRQFRGKDRATDVLSFPANDAVEGLAGEIAISAEIASEHALQLGHSTAEEIKILTLHGILHLAGYDHELDNGEMEKKELRLRKALRLPVGLIERVSKGRQSKQASR